MKLFQRLLYALLGILLCLSCTIAQASPQQSSQSSQTPSAPRTTVLSIQHEIETARARLSSGDEETRRDAVMRLGSLARADASRAASVALNDSAARVRIAAARAVLALPADEAAALLIPLLNDRGRRRERNEVVRLSAAYAIGEAGSQTATLSLIAALEDRSAGVRGAAAIALGQIEDERAVPALVGIL